MKVGTRMLIQVNTLCYIIYAVSWLTTKCVFHLLVINVKICFLYIIVMS